jgi:hypothetical protein
MKCNECEATSKKTRSNEDIVEQQAGLWSGHVKHHHVVWICGKHYTSLPLNKEERYHGLLMLVPKESVVLPKLHSLAQEEYKRARLTFFDDDVVSDSKTFFVQNLKIPVVRAKVFLNMLLDYTVKGCSVELEKAWLGDDYFYNASVDRKGKLPKCYCSFIPSTFFSEKKRETCKLSQQISNGGVEHFREANAILELVKKWNPPPAEWFNSKDCDWIDADCVRYSPNQTTTFMRSVATGLLTVPFWHAEQMGLCALNFAMPLFGYFLRDGMKRSKLVCDCVQVWKGGYVRSLHKNAKMLELSAQSWTCPTETFLQMDWTTYLDEQELVTQFAGQIVYSRNADLSNVSEMRVQYHCVTGTGGLSNSLANNYLDKRPKLENFFRCSEALLSYLNVNRDLWKLFMSNNNFLQGLFRQFVIVS